MVLWRNDNFSLINNLKLFFSRKDIVVLCSIAGLVLGICLAILLPSEYESRTIILVEEGKSDNPLFSNLAVSTTVQQRLNAIRESMLGWESMVQLVRRLELDKDVKTPKEFEGLIRRLRARIDIRLQGDNIIKITYTGFDPKTTQAVVQNITNIFIERNKEIQRKETADAIRFIEEQLRIYKAKIKSAEIAKLEDELKDLLIDSTEKHPLVIDLKEKIARKKEELAAENLEYIPVERLDLETNNELINSIQEALHKIEKPTPTPEPIPGMRESSRAVAKIALIEKMEKVMARDVGVNEQIYNMLLQRLETAKITQRLQESKEGTHYRIIEPPRVPLEPSKPNRVLIALAGLVFGVMSGVGLSFVSIFFDKSFIDVTEAKEYLGTPLLGGISKILTDDTLRQERDQRRWRYSLAVVTGIIVIVLTLTVSNMMGH